MGFGSVPGLGRRLGWRRGLEDALRGLRRATRWRHRPRGEPSRPWEARFAPDIHRKRLENGLFGPSKGDSRLENGRFALISVALKALEELQQALSIAAPAANLSRLRTQALLQPLGSFDRWFLHGNGLFSDGFGSKIAVWKGF